MRPSPVGAATASAEATGGNGRRCPEGRPSARLPRNRSSRGPSGTVLAAYTDGTSSSGSLLHAFTQMPVRRPVVEMNPGYVRRLLRGRVPVRVRVQQTSSEARRSRSGAWDPAGPDSLAGTDPALSSTTGWRTFFRFLRPIGLWTERARLPQADAFVKVVRFYSYFFGLMKRRIL